MAGLNSHHFAHVVMLEVDGLVDQLRLAEIDLIIYQLEKQLAYF